MVHVKLATFTSIRDGTATGTATIAVEILIPQMDSPKIVQ